VEVEGMAARCGVKFGMVLVKVGTEVMRSSERAFKMLKMRSDSTTTTFRQCTEGNITGAERARTVAQSEQQADREGEPLKEDDNERMEVTDEEDGGGDDCSATLGRYWKDSYPELKPMDMVRAHGTRGGIKMVISQQQDKVEVVEW
jgi:hypothetical protein